MVRLGLIGMKHTSENITPVIDGDMFVFKATAATEYEIEWGNDLWTLHGYLDDGIFAFKSLMAEVYNNLYKKLPLEVLLTAPTIAFSDSEVNFRKGILPDYKGNRIGKRKPVCYAPLRDWVCGNYECLCLPYIEGDDVMGMLATEADKTNPVILVSGDKDFKTVPCDFYDFNKDTLTHITERDAMRNHAIQTLTGDVADNYKGCPGYGPVKAKRLLEKVEDADVWKEVIKAYREAGLTADDALTQARCAHILQGEESDIFGHIRLWEFPKNVQDWLSANPA